MRFCIPLIICLFTFVCSNCAMAAEPLKPKVVALMFYSDSCGSCKVLDPKVQEAKNDLASKPILFVKFDHSNDKTSNQAALLADKLGVGKVYKAQKKKSGFLLLVDSMNDKVVDKITKDMSKDDIKSKMNKAIM